MRYLLLLIVSFPAFAFNDWRIECTGQMDGGKTMRISDERISGERKNRLVDLSVWDGPRSIAWSTQGRTYVSNKSVREGFFFQRGKRVNYRLRYLDGFTRLPSESRVDLRNPNSELELTFYQGVSTNSGIEASQSLKLACYYRKGGE